MIKLAVYGKGGIGKSTISANLSAVFAKKGYRVMQIGCDPKADSTALLHHGTRIRTVLELERTAGNKITLPDLITETESGVICVEAGGPVPGVGCAGRGIINALETLKKLGAYEVCKPDIVIYDVLGDVVCGGFAAPIREGYAEQVLIVTSGEKMALYAANNIHNAVKNFEDRSYAKVRGIIMNRRNVPDEEAKVRAFADANGLPVAADIPRSDDISRFEDMGKTVIEGDPDCETAKRFFALADLLIAEESAGSSL